MTTTYTKSLATNFGGSLSSGQFHLEVAADVGITPNLLHIDVTGDVVDIVFDAALSAGEQTTLDGLITAHTPATLNIQPDFYISPGSDVIKFDKDATTYKLIGNQTDEIIISKSSQGDYTSIKDAITNNNNPNMTKSKRNFFGLVGIVDKNLIDTFDKDSVYDLKNNLKNWIFLSDNKDIGEYVLYNDIIKIKT